MAGLQLKISLVDDGREFDGMLGCDWDPMVTHDADMRAALFPIVDVSCCDVLACTFRLMVERACDVTCSVCRLELRFVSDGNGCCSVVRLPALP